MKFTEIRSLYGKYKNNSDWDKYVKLTPGHLLTPEALELPHSLHSDLILYKYHWHIVRYAYALYCAYFKIPIRIDEPQKRIYKLYWSVRTRWRFYDCYIPEFDDILNMLFLEAYKIIQRMRKDYNYFLEKMKLHTKPGTELVSDKSHRFYSSVYMMLIYYYGFYAFCQRFSPLISTKKIAASINWKPDWDEKFERNRPDIELESDTYEADLLLESLLDPSRNKLQDYLSYQRLSQKDFQITNDHFPYIDKESQRKSREFVYPRLKEEKKKKISKRIKKKIELQ